MSISVTVNTLFQSLDRIGRLTHALLMICQLLAFTGVASDPYLVQPLKFNIHAACRSV